MAKRKIIVLGGGIAGLSAAYHLCRGGEYDVTVIEAASVGHGTTSKAAGMITPVPELAVKDEAFVRDSVAASSYFHEFVSEVTRAQPVAADYRREGTLMCARSETGAKDLRELAQFQRQMGLDVIDVAPTDLKRRESALADVTCAAFIPGEASVDPLRLALTLKDAVLNAGGRVLEGVSVKRAHIRGERIEKIHLGHARTLSADAFVLATGLDHAISELHEAEPLPLRPVKGQGFAVQSEPGFLKHAIRYFAGRAYYIVPRSTGEIVVAATSEEKSDAHPTPRGLAELTAAAGEILPALPDLPLLRSWAGLRPTTPDALPVAGRGWLENTYWLAGLYRHGIKMAPYLGRELAHLVREEKSALDWARYDVRRFTPRP